MICWFSRVHPSLWPWEEVQKWRSWCAAISSVSVYWTPAERLNLLLGAFNLFAVVVSGAFKVA